MQGGLLALFSRSKARNFHTNRSGWRFAARGMAFAQVCPVRVFERFCMLRWAVVFLIIAIIAAIFGFGGIVGTAVGIAKILFAIFLVLFLVSLILGRRGRTMP
jgi:uncharacterized membrane protein YtjA (UPF0391 family)